MSGLPYEGWLVNKLYRPAGTLKVKSLPHGTTIAMPRKNPAAVALGRLGGKSTSKRKAAAARRNGQKGGWPKGKRRKDEPMNLEPMTVKHELRDSDGVRIKTGRVKVDRKRGTVTYVAPELPPGTYRQTITLQPASGRPKGKQR